MIALLPDHGMRMP